MPTLNLESLDSAATRWALAQMQVIADKAIMPSVHGLQRGTVPGVRSLSKRNMMGGWLPPSLLERRQRALESRLVAFYKRSTDAELQEFERDVIGAFKRL